MFGQEHNHTLSHLLFTREFLFCKYFLFLIMETEKKQVEYLIADTTAFIQNAPLQVRILLNVFQ